MEQNLKNKTYKTITDKNDERAKLSKLYYETLSEGENYTLLQVNLFTGRKHQIRTQLSHIGHPIKGDLKYGAKRSNKDGGISLEAHKIEFIHPVSKQPISISLEDRL